MKHQLTFTAEHDYSQHEAIDLNITLSDGNLSTSFEASVDTGSTFCIFKRGHAEVLHLDVEAGTPIRIGTATGCAGRYRVRMGVQRKTGALPAPASRRLD